MNLVGAVNSMTGKRYYNNGMTVGTKGASFQQSLTSARTTAEGTWKRGTIVVPGVSTLQFYLEHYVRGSAPMPTELSKEKIQTLAEKYDLQTMTEESLDSFLDDLVHTGLFTKDELGSVIYGGEMRQVGVLPEGRFLPYRTPGMPICGVDSEMQEWANANEYLLWGDALPDGTPVFPVKQAGTLMKLMPILERMEQLRR